MCCDDMLGARASGFLTMGLCRRCVVTTDVVTGSLNFSVFDNFLSLKHTMSEKLEAIKNYVHTKVTSQLVCFTNY